ncbi:type VII secretion protein EccE [Amycolatopsis alkalitolerans]|uniref:Type VII secretion protein EccE n=1 Tax=Amycolatopsis alkalitolerans TaxID=2547244 RepID=A0A5C4LYV3_9PSEU|nr:type VII secretion protein EccE [Amycolatopsis alkalitolerans]TNC23909.1 type VII secretion protein EccE [Amycolatopsis alkalitolerans]
MTTASARIPAFGGPTGPTAMLPVRPAQVVVWTIALTVSLVDRGIAVAAIAALVVGTTSVRVAGRHLAGWAGIWIWYRLLQHDDRRLGDDPLLVLAPDFRLRQHRDRAGNSFGVVGVDGGWTAVLRLDPAGEPDVAALTAILREACDNADIPLASAQLLVRSEHGRRVHLIAVRYRPAEAPLAALARGSGEVGEHRATVRAALGVLGTLTEAGIAATVLEAGELAAELRETLGVKGDLLAHSHRATAVVNGWRSWSAAGTTQACFTPKAGVERAFAVSDSEVAFTVTSYELRRTHLGRLREDLTIRAVKYQGTRKAPRAEDLDVPVVPLYGRHEVAVRRTLPLALPG